MKRSRIIRLLGIAVIVSLLVAAIPASVVFAQWYHMVPTPTQGAIGETITITGSGFPATADPGNPQIVMIYFSSQDASVGNSIGTHVTTYKTISQITTNTLGQFNTSFVVPSTFATGGSVNPGIHYFYACCPPSNPMIQGKATFTVLGAGELSINIDEGPVDTLVQVSGSSFSASQPITIEFAGDEVEIEQGSTATGTTGSFVSHISVPEIRAGTHAIQVTVGTGTSAVVETIDFTVTPDIIISPQSGYAGTSVTISGTGFARRELVDVYYNSQTPVVSDLLTDTRGSFYTTFTVPEIAGLTAGAYAIEAEDEDFNLATTMFTLNIETEPEPTETQEPEPTETQPEPEPTETAAEIKVNSNGDTVGSIIIISGGGFTPNTEVIVKYDNTIVITATSNANGLIVTDGFFVPASKGGDHNITASDGIQTATAVFTVESEAPDIPPPLSPSMGAKIDSPMSFDWEDVTDNSKRPVTYMLQIATDEDFSSGSIVLEKTEIELSEYTLTPEEELELAGQKEPYYWRVQAIDNASNESGWTGAGEVYIAPPFSFPKWLLYTLLAVGAVLIFIIGYWLGRRTAFMY